MRLSVASYATLDVSRLLYANLVLNSEQSRIKPYYDITQD